MFHTARARQPLASAALIAAAVGVLVYEVVGLSVNLHGISVGRFAAPVTRGAPKASGLGSGMITTIAGTGEYGLDGDTGPGARAVLARPYGVAVLPGGDIVISDTGNRRLRVLHEGIIDTLSLSNMETKTSCLQPLPKDCATVAPAASGASYWRNFGEPRGIAFDAGGNLYVADGAENRVWTITRSRIITHAWGRGYPGFRGDGVDVDQADFLHPGAVTAAPDGTVFVADTYNNRVRAVSPAALVSTVAGGGRDAKQVVARATSASLSDPTDVAVGPDGLLYIADTGNNRVVRLDTDGSLHTIAGTGTTGYSSDRLPALETRLDHPNGIAFDAHGNLYISDSGNNRVRRLERDGTMVTVAGDGHGTYAGDGRRATDASLHFPTAIAFTPNGDLVIVDTFNNRVRLVRGLAAA